MSQRAMMLVRTERASAGLRGAWSVRDFDPVRDADAVHRLDRSYTSGHAYTVHRSGDVVAIAPTATAAPHSARVAIDLGVGLGVAPDVGRSPGAAPVWTDARVAVLDGRVRGFLAWRCEPGGRMTIVHFHVDRPYRLRGGGRQLLDDALDRAHRAGATLAWLETSSANYPAITVARRLGFEICGFDTTLYRGTAQPGEVGVYMAHLIDGDART